MEKDVEGGHEIQNGFVLPCTVMKWHWSCLGRDRENTWCHNCLNKDGLLGHTKKMPHNREMQIWLTLLVGHGLQGFGPLLIAFLYLEYVLCSRPRLPTMASWLLQLQASQRDYHTAQWTFALWCFFSDKRTFPWRLSLPFSSSLTSFQWELGHTWTPMIKLD